MLDAVARAIHRADLICLHLDPSYVPGSEVVRTLVTKREAERIARLAAPGGGTQIAWEGERLILSPPVKGTAAPPARTGLPDDPVAATIRLTKVAAEQGSAIMRMRIALSVLLTCGHGEAQHIVRTWFEAGGTGPIPYPTGALFQPWADQRGIQNVQGFMGFRVIAGATPGEAFRG